MSMNSLKAVNPLVNAFITDLYRDFPKLDDWFSASTTTTNFNHPLPSTVPSEAESSTWDSSIGFYSKVGFNSALKSYKKLEKEKEIHERLVAAEGTAGNGDLGVADFDFEFGGMGFGNVETVADSGDAMEFLGSSTENPLDWQFMNEP